MEPLAVIPNLIEQVHLRLVDAIADGTLAPGERLTQDEIAHRLAVSRQPVSHALQLLKRQGLVVEEGKRGLSVARIEAARIRDLYEVRASLDSLASRLAAEQVASGRAPRRATDAVRAAFAAGQAIEAEPTVRGLIAADVAFHTSIYALSGNTAVVDTVEGLWPHFKRCMGIALAQADYHREVWQEHAAIVEAILAGNARAAVKAAAFHTEKAGRKLYADLSGREHKA